MSPRSPGALAAVALLVLVPAVACSNSPTACSAPTSGSFSLALSYAQRVTAAIACTGDATDTNACSTQSPPFGVATWSLTVSGATATVTPGGGASFTCEVISPNAGPETTADGGPIAATGCYLLVSCGAQAVGDAGTAGVQIQILPQSSDDASPDVIALVSESSGACCNYQYNGSYTSP